MARKYRSTPKAEIFSRRCVLPETGKVWFELEKKKIGPNISVNLLNRNDFKTMFKAFLSYNEMAGRAKTEKQIN